MVVFQSWPELGRVALTALLAYVVCVALISLFGKRSSAKMNNFDWIVTVAMGSMLGSSVLMKKVVILELVVGLGILLLLQYLFTKFSVHVPGFKKVMKKSPTLLFFDGKYIDQALQHERVTKEEIRVGIRSQGLIDELEVNAVIIEPNGELSIIPKAERPPRCAQDIKQTLARSDR